MPQCTQNKLKMLMNLFFVIHFLRRQGEACKGKFYDSHSAESHSKNFGKCQLLTLCAMLVSTKADYALCYSEHSLTPHWVSQDGGSDEFL